MGPYGADFEMPFEIQIDKDYFQAIFGKTTAPQKRDVIFFPDTSRIYEISSSYLYRDFLNEPLYFKATLIKWQPKSNAEASPDLASLESFAPSFEKIFGKDQEEERKDIANPEQFTDTNVITDLTRDFLSPDSSIVDEQFLNYFTVVSEHYYDLSASLSSTTISVHLDKESMQKLTPGKVYFVRSPKEIQKGYIELNQSITIIPEGLLTIEVPLNLSYAFGQTVILTRENDYISGTVNSYTGDILEINVLSSSGAGAYNTWTINIPYTDPIQTLYSIRKIKYKGIGIEGDALFEMTSSLSQYSNSFENHQIFNINSPFAVYESEYIAPNDVQLFNCKRNSQSAQNEVVRYKATDENLLNKDFAFSAWFKLTNKKHFTSNIESLTYDEYSGKLTVTYQSPHQFLIGDLLSIRRRSGNFELIGTITQIQNNKTFVLELNTHILSHINTVFGNTWLSYQDLSIALTYPKVYISSHVNAQGIKIELYGKRYFLVTINEKEFFFVIPNTQPDLEEIKWYAICVSASNIFSELTLTIWELKWNSITNSPSTSDLKPTFASISKHYSNKYQGSKTNFRLYPSDMNLTNIRVWSQKIETEKQQLILNQNIVKDAKHAILIDNAIPVSRLPYITYTH